MQFSELKAMLSTLLADSSSNFYTDAERAFALNNAARVVNADLRMLRTVAEYTTTQLDKGISFPGDYAAPGQGVDWVDRNGIVTRLDVTTLQHLRGRDATWESQTGIPGSYFIDGDKLYLYPQPTDTGTLRISYVPQPNVMSADTHLPWYGDNRLTAYHDIIAWHAAGYLALKERDFDFYKVAQQNFSMRMIELSETLRKSFDAIQPYRDDYAANQ